MTIKMWRCWLGEVAFISLLSSYTAMAILYGLHINLWLPYKAGTWSSIFCILHYYSGLAKVTDLTIWFVTVKLLILHLLSMHLYLYRWLQFTYYIYMLYINIYINILHIYVHIYIYIYIFIYIYIYRYSSIFFHITCITWTVKQLKNHLSKKSFTD